MTHTWTLLILSQSETFFYAFITESMQTLLDNTRILYIAQADWTAEFLTQVIKLHRPYSAGIFCIFSKRLAVDIKLCQAGDFDTFLPFRHRIEFC